MELASVKLPHGRLRGKSQLKETTCRKRLTLIDSIEDEAEDRLVDMIPFECIMTQLFEIPKYPHRACVSCHEVPDATGLIRSELMLLVGMMTIRILREEKEFIDDQTFPVSS